jgi:hypothetical protein
MTIIYTIPSVRGAWADLATPWNGTTGDIADPGNTYVEAGWTSTTLPPPYQYFNWALNWVSGAVRYFMQNGIVDWQAAELYQVGAIVSYNGYLWQCYAANTTGTPPSSGTPGSASVSAPWQRLRDYACAEDLVPLVTNTQLSAILAAYAAKNSPTFTGAPLSTTPPTADSSTRIATTAQVQAAIAAALAAYLSNSSAAATYLTIASAAATYLTRATAASTYLTLTAAASTYATIAYANGTSTKSSYVRQVLPSGVIYLDGETPTLAQGANAVVFPVAFPTACRSVQVTPIGNSASWAITGLTAAEFTMNTGAAEPYYYHAVGY